MQLHHITDDATGIEYVTFSDPRHVGTMRGGARGVRITEGLKREGLLRVVGTTFQVRELIEGGGAILSEHDTIETARKAAFAERQRRLAA
jgi:hypothetical protein